MDQLGMFEVTPVFPTRRGFIEPGTPQHLAMISPSKVASICGVSRFHSAYTVWMRMAGRIGPEPDADRFRVGHAFESALAELWKLEHPGWKLSPGEVQYVSEEFGFPTVATPDRRACRGRARKVIELKTARDLGEWGDPNLDGDCPADYALQVQAEQLFCGMTNWPADLVLMGPYFAHHTYPVSFDEKVGEWMLAVCRRFWKSLADDQPPDLDDSVSTYTTLRQLHPDIEPGTSVEIPEALASDYLTALTECKSADAVLVGLKSKILSEAGSAQFIECNGERVAARQPHFRGGVSLVAKMDPSQLTAR
jgi:predicted phage-related endonuclease